MALGKSRKKGSVKRLGSPRYIPAVPMQSGRPAKKRGRPKGSKNKPKKRGRPKGSKSKVSKARKGRRTAKQIAATKKLVTYNRSKKKGSKKRSRKGTTSSKNQIPLDILLKRANKLNNIVKRRGGKIRC